MSGLRSASDWKTRAKVYMPPAAIIHAITAPNGPVARANVRGKEKIPAPIIEPMTSADNENKDNLFCDDAAIAYSLPKIFYFLVDLLHI